MNCELQMAKDCRLAIGLVHESLTAGEEAERLVDVLVSPDGHVKSSSGDYVVDEEAWQHIEQAFRERGNSLVFDYGHHSVGGVYAAPDGTERAAGWIEKLRYEKGRGIIGSVKWTDRARALIRADEYRFPSPALFVRKSDRRAISLVSVGLVNTPAIYGIERVAAKEKPFGTETNTMPEETGQETAAGADLGSIIGEIKALLDLEVEDTADLVAKVIAIRDAVKKMKSGGSEEEGSEEAVASKAVVPKAVAEALALKEDASPAEVALAVNALSQKATQVEELTKQMKAQGKQMAEMAFKDALQPHLDAGRILPNSEATIANLHKVFDEQGREQFDFWANKVQEGPPPGQTTPPPGGPGEGNKRETIIANAQKEWTDNKTAQITGILPWVNGALREVNKGALTEDEQKELVAA